jgi:glutathione S-transferase
VGTVRRNTVTTAVREQEPPVTFESAAILIYLSEKTDGKLIPKDPFGRYKCLE